MKGVMSDRILLPSNWLFWSKKDTCIYSLVGNPSYILTYSCIECMLRLEFATQGSASLHQLSTCVSSCLVDWTTWAILRAVHRTWPSNYPHNIKREWVAWRPCDCSLGRPWGPSLKRRRPEGKSHGRSRKTGTSGVYIWWSHVLP